MTPWALYKIHSAVLFALFVFADPGLGLPLWFADFALGMGALLGQWHVVDGWYAAAGYLVAFGVLRAAMCTLYALMVMGER